MQDSRPVSQAQPSARLSAHAPAVENANQSRVSRAISYALNCVKAFFSSLMFCSSKVDDENIDGLKGRVSRSSSESASISSVSADWSQYVDGELQSGEDGNYPKGLTQDQVVFIKARSGSHNPNAALRERILEDLILVAKGNPKLVEQFVNLPASSVKSLPLAQTPDKSRTSSSSSTGESRHQSDLDLQKVIGIMNKRISRLPKDKLQFILDEHAFALSQRCMEIAVYLKESANDSNLTKENRLYTPEDSTLVIRYYLSEPERLAIIILDTVLKEATTHLYNDEALSIRNLLSLVESRLESLD